MSNEQYDRTARVMFLLVWAILFIGLFLFFYYQGQPEKQAYISGRSEMVLSATQDGHYHVKGTINDYPVKFLVDTGATLVAIPQSVADRLHINGSYPITMTTANGEVTGYLTRVQKLSFGEFSLQDVKAVIMPNSSDDEVLLGMNVLSKFNLEQQNKKLILKRIN
ncbi:retropepsin-like aspartic protease family protein [Legionella fallonii]|uniref:Aspartyl protease n=1 Tax=Legionella fallonii LLAP-10 TaxID=1212491 RepID=A0A098G6H0_9GAMM|nr:retropepsin-like aspartic protease [Legionella fallonii]CEG57581.1 aspartyl protease [Legionella fallonii LLAP-10]